MVGFFFIIKVTVNSRQSKGPSSWPPFPEMCPSGNSKIPTSRQLTVAQSFPETGITKGDVERVVPPGLKGLIGKQKDKRIRPENVTHLYITTKTSTFLTPSPRPPDFPFRPSSPSEFLTRIVEIPSWRRVPPQKNRYGNKESFFPNSVHTPTVLSSAPGLFRTI